MRIFVDGHNAIFACAELKHLSGQDQRNHLIDVLRATGQNRLGHGKITVVFDAPDSVMTSHDSVGGLAVVYAPVADDAIVSMVQKAGGQCTVVTNDMRMRARISQDVGRHVRYLDTAVIFTARAEKGHRAAARNASGASAQVGADDKRLPSKSQRDITAELMELWVDEDTE